MNKFKDSDFGLIPAHWEIKKIKEVLKIKGRIGWKGYKTSDLRESGPVVIGGTNIKSQLNLDFSDITYLSQEKYDESPEIQVKKGDVILVARGNGIGAVGMYKGEFKEATINPSVVILSDFIGINEFLVYFLLSPQGNGQIMSNEGGSSIPALYQGVLNNVPILLPPVTEQQSIAEVLSSLDDKIDLLHRQNKTLEQMAETLFRQWFVEEAKEDWEEKPLDQLAEYLNGLALQKFPSIPGKPTLPAIKIREMNQGITEATDIVSAEIPEKYIVNDGDILFSWSGSLDVIIWTGGKGALNQHLFKVTSSSYPKWFIYFSTRLFLPEFRDIANDKATTMGHIQRSHLTQSVLKIPPQKKIEKSDKILSDLFDKIIQNKIQVRSIEKLRDTLLPKLMNGSVRITIS